MDGGAQENAMTEIALAMAMGFFSVMVLTAMSMGVAAQAPKTTAPRITTAAIAASAATPSPGAADRLSDDDVLIIHDGRQFLGRDLKPLDPARITRGRRVVLALTPDLTMAQAIAARRKIAAERLVITTLDAKWRHALRERTDARR